MFSDRNNANWQPRRIEYMVWCVLIALVAWRGQSPEIWRKRVKRAKPRRRHFRFLRQGSHDSSLSSSLRCYTATLRSLFPGKRNVSP